MASANKNHHAANLPFLFCCLREYRLVINDELCLLGVKELDFLGHQISTASASPLPAYVEAVEAFSPPTTVQELQLFFGLINFYRRFLPGLAATLKPLTDALQGAKHGADVVAWSTDKEAAFVEAKRALVGWHNPSQTAVVSLAVDISATHVGACLQQKSQGSAAWQPLGFYLKKLDKAQTKYSAFYRELMACYLGIQHLLPGLSKGRDTTAAVANPAHHHGNPEVYTSTYIWTWWVGPLPTAKNGEWGTFPHS